MNTSKCPRARTTLAEWRRRAESGFNVTIQSIYYVFLLFIFLALVFDFGNVGYVSSIASSAAFVAAQDAAKNIDVDAFIEHQEIRLNANALSRAQDIVSGMTDGHVTVSDVSISHLRTRDVIVVRGTAVAALPLLNTVFNMATVSIPIEAYAEPAYGISEEGQ
jgi:hypothetical protein